MSSRVTVVVAVPPLVTFAFGTAAGAGVAAPGRRADTRAAVPPDARTADRTAAARTVRAPPRRRRRAPLPGPANVVTGCVGAGSKRGAAGSSVELRHDPSAASPIRCRAASAQPPVGGSAGAGGHPGGPAGSERAGASAAGIASVAGSRGGEPRKEESSDAIRPFSGSDRVGSILMTPRSREIVLRRRVRRRLGGDQPPWPLASGASDSSAPSRFGFSSFGRRSWPLRTLVASIEPSERF